MLDKIDLNKKLSKKVYKRVMPELANRLYSIQKASWDAASQWSFSSRVGMRPVKAPPSRN